MSDDPAGALAVVCVTVCLELCGGFCLDFASISKSPRALVAHVFDFLPQLAHAPVVSAHGRSTLARMTMLKMRIRENGISSYQSPRLRVEPLKRWSSRPNHHRIQPCPNLNLLHNPASFVCPFPVFHRVFREIVLQLSREWVTTTMICISAFSAPTIRSIRMLISFCLQLGCLLPACPISS